MKFLVNIGGWTFIIQTIIPFGWMRPKTPLFSLLKYEKKKKRKSQIMYKLIFNKKIGRLFKNRKRIRTWYLLAQQINIKQMLKYPTIFENSGVKNLKHGSFLLNINLYIICDFLFLFFSYFRGLKKGVYDRI